MGSASPYSFLDASRSTNQIHMSSTVNLVSELERIATALNEDSGAAPELSLASIAEKIAKSLGVRTDELAILGVSRRWRHLHFLVPEALKNVGFIPLSSNSALAARTARDNRANIENNFTVARHAAFFESVNIAGDSGEAIQKIMSAPISADGKVVGVIQVSRKGPDPASAGPDFLSDDLAKVLALCKPLGKLLQRIILE